MKNKLDKNIISETISDLEVKNKDKIISFLSLYYQGEFIYPSVIKRNCKLSKEESSFVLNALVDKGILKISFNYVCSVCSHRIYESESFKEDEDIFCPCCDEKIDKNYREVYYQVL